METAKWIWMPHAGHLIVGRSCQFHLATYVGNYLVSTVGEYLPDETVREIHANARGVRLEGKGDERLADFMKKCGYVEIGFNRLYETMVFTAEQEEESPDWDCCPWRMGSGTELDMQGYNTPGDAYHGHLAMCKTWSQK